MTTQQLFKKYILLCESQKKIEEEYQKLCSEINKLVSTVYRIQTGKIFKQLDEIAKLRTAGKSKQIEAAQIKDQLNDVKQVILELLEGIQEIEFDVTVKSREKALRYFIAKTAETEITYGLA